MQRERAGGEQLDEHPPRPDATWIPEVISAFGDPSSAIFGDLPAELPRAVAAAVGMACVAADPHACTGLGACVRDVCACFSGWKGADCATLDVRPVRAARSGWPQAQLGGRPNWGAAVVWEADEGAWYSFVGAKRDMSEGAPDTFAANSGLHLLTSPHVGGPWTYVREERTNADGPLGFRVDVKRDPTDGALLLITEGYAAGTGFGFILRRSPSGSALGPWTEHLVYELTSVEVDGATDWTADASNTDPDRWDCRMADPSLAILPSGEAVVAYRGTPCCCNAHIGAWGPAGEHEPEKMGLLRASSWAGTYVRTGAPIFAGDGGDNEDPYLWVGPRGGLHMLMHSQNPSHNDNDVRGAVAFSSDGGASWRRSVSDARSDLD